MVTVYGVLLHQTDYNEATTVFLEPSVAACPQSDEFYDHLGVFRCALSQL
jgi:hypothetical protein